MRKVIFFTFTQIYVKISKIKPKKHDFWGFTWIFLKIFWIKVIIFKFALYLGYFSKKFG